MWGRRYKTGIRPATKLKIFLLLLIVVVLAHQAGCWSYGHNPVKDKFQYLNKEVPGFGKVKAADIDIDVNPDNLDLNKPNPYPETEEINCEDDSTDVIEENKTVGNNESNGTKIAGYQINLDIKKTK